VLFGSLGKVLPMEEVKFMSIRSETPPPQLGSQGGLSKTPEPDLFCDEAWRHKDSIKVRRSKVVNKDE
jgi:hypothetical protein